VTCNGEADTRPAPVISESEAAFGSGLFCPKRPERQEIFQKEGVRVGADGPHPLLLESLRLLTVKGECAIIRA